MIDRELECGIINAVLITKLLLFIYSCCAMFLCMMIIDIIIHLCYKIKLIIIYSLRALQ